MAQRQLGIISSAYGNGAGYGYGYAYGYGYGYGHAYGNGNGYGYGHAYGHAYGNGAGYGYGHAYGNGAGYGYGLGYGIGYGNDIGSGSDYGIRKLFFAGLPARHILDYPNAELKREMIEAIGADRFFSELEGQIVYQDTDGCGNPRQLVRLKIPEAEAGYLQAVKVVCPTTGRVYHLGVPPHVKTCQEAVAATFGVKPDDYYPDRET